MKKWILILLALVMALSFSACGTPAADEGNGATTDAVLPADGIDTLNAVLEAGFAVVGTRIVENVYAQTVVNSKDDRFIVIVKPAEEQLDAFQSIDFLGDNAQEEYRSVIGGNPLIDVVAGSDWLPSKEQLDLYQGMTIADFEWQGAELNGYFGESGKYTFSFSDSIADYRIALADGTKLEDLDDLDRFDAAIQNIAIGKAECIGFSSAFLDNYLEQYLDAPEKVTPTAMGEAKASLDEINQMVGCSIQPIPGAANETYSVIDGKIAQYICTVDDVYYCVRSAADMTVNLAEDSFVEDPIVDENGYVTISTSQSDTINSVRFVFDGYQYAYLIYDNGAFDWTEFDERQSAYRNSVCVYPEGSALAKFMGMHTADDNYSMSVIPVSGESAQVSVFTYNETEQKLWTMIVHESSDGLAYDKSVLERYQSGDLSKEDAGKGIITIADDAWTWEGHTFR